MYESAILLDICSGEWKTYAHTKTRTSKLTAVVNKKQSNVYQLIYGFQNVLYLYSRILFSQR